MKIPNNCACCQYFDYAISGWSGNHRKRCRHPDTPIDYKYYVPFEPDVLPENCPFQKEQQNDTKSI